ncbi:Heme/hemopexin utilization protein C precursor [compost metagenome]
MQDLYVSGLHFPGGGPVPNNFFIANPDLKPETADTYEIGTKNIWHLSDSELINLSATYFLTDAKDFINRDVDVSGGTTKFNNLDEVRLQGFEISTKWQNMNYGAGLSYGQVRSENKNTHEPLSDTPADHWLGKFETYFGEFLIVGTDLKYVQRQDKVPPKTNPTADYFVEDFYAGYKQGLWRVNLRLNNAFDRSYRPHGSSIDAEGRSLKAVVSYLL